ncbi:MAG: hypothetical protein CM1200mP5_6460 [Candidatus Pelagibacterales bacterium]|nr:MAG: hypothetical protein CM1200mP5_6460 [Pelagibacterales bacterium]
MPDCDLDQAVNGLMGAAYGSAEKVMAKSFALLWDLDHLVSKLIKKLKL